MWHPSLLVRPEDETVSFPTSLVLPNYANNKKNNDKQKHSSDYKNGFMT